MLKRTISILIAERDRYFAHGLGVGLKTFCHTRGISLRLIDKSDILENGVDIIFLGDSSACPPWLYELYQHGCIPCVFFIREKSMAGNPVTHIDCGADTLYRDQPIRAIEAMLDKVLSPQYSSPSLGTCRCTPLLTFRETEVLKYLAIGMSGHDTAGRLGIKDKTVNGHKRNAMRKLCIKSNQELYRWMELGGTSHLNYQSLHAWPKPVCGL